jgi:ATP-dependent RNA circularization protein (DNA/RNA ligase family)
MILSYPSIYALGHRAIRELFDGPVVVEEKIDGSQFSFGVSARRGSWVSRILQKTIGHY